MNLDVKVGVLEMKLCQVENTPHKVLGRLPAASKPLEQGEVIFHLQAQLNEFGEGSRSKARNRAWIGWKLK